MGTRWSTAHNNVLREHSIARFWLTSTCNFEPFPCINLWITDSRKWSNRQQRKGCTDLAFSLLPALHQQALDSWLASVYFTTVHTMQNFSVMLKTASSKAMCYFTHSKVCVCVKIFFPSPCKNIKPQGHQLVKEENKVPCSVDTNGMCQWI